MAGWRDSDRAQQRHVAMDLDTGQPDHPDHLAFAGGDDEGGQMWASAPSSGNPLD